MNIVILGLSITSSWGNGHATTYRSLVKGLYQRGHQVTFLERNMPWYAAQRDMLYSEFCTVHLYDSISILKSQFLSEVKQADLVMVGSYVPEGVLVGKWVTQIAQGIKAFYDIDTPVTFSKLKNKDFEYIHPDQIPLYDLYLSFTGGPALQVLMSEFGAPNAKPLYCSVDTDLYFPQTLEPLWDLGYLGTYSNDRQAPLENLMIEAANKWTQGKFVVAGSQYPRSVCWPRNVEHIEHLPSFNHCKFYNEQRFALNITRKEMIRLGYAPSVRLFEAAACGIPVISDYWNGLEQFFELNREILISQSADDTIRFLKETPEDVRKKIGVNARKKVLKKHTAEYRAKELEQYIKEIRELAGNVKKTHSVKQ